MTIGCLRTNVDEWDLDLGSYCLDRAARCADGLGTKIDKHQTAFESKQPVASMRAFIPQFSNTSN